MTSINVECLFETSALKISPANSPFWYTSGLIGPYYINTHYLCGGEQTALEVLSFIDKNCQDKKQFPDLMLAKLESIYETHSIYRKVVDELCNVAKNKLPIEEVTYLSGGQRRDWFFAPIVAKNLGKPCIYLYNDLSAYDDCGKKIVSLDNACVLNVADLLNVGSSYSKKWIPAISSLGGNLLWSLNVVDRNEGAVENLLRDGVKETISLFVIGKQLFDKALEAKCIDSSQYDLALGYLEQPFDSMREFLLANPGFLEEAKNSSDLKKQERYKLMLRENLYKL
jgi:orotate phosphoribosyltransferase